uniref:Uncharacterized protein n=1 Tax=Panagrolaimus davidi TaxID=227884 RepID=A0A914PTH0_9BILA
MPRFFNVKNDNSAVGPKIIWDEEINVLQPEVGAVLDELRNDKEIVFPLKSAGKQENDKIYEIQYISIDNSSINSDASFKENIYNNYSSEVPLLEEHKNELSQIFSTIEENPIPILTGRRTIRKLAENRKVIYTLKKFKIGEKEYYSLHQPYTFSGEKYCGSHLEKLEQIYSTLIKKSTETQYTDMHL